MKKFLLITTALTLSACSLTPDYTRPTVDTASSYREQSVQGAEVPAQDWWKKFNSAELDTLIANALKNNTDLRMSFARIEQARTDIKLAGAALLPTVSASGGASVTRTDPPSAGADIRRGADIGLNLAYEADLFGAGRAAILSARANYQGTQYDSDAVKLVVTGDVAQNFFNLVNTRERIRVAENNLKISQDVLNIIQARFDAGAVSGLEVAQQRTQLAASQAALASLQEQESVYLNALGVLLGQAPQNTTVTTTTLDGLTAPAIDAGLPSELLARRPDIAAAEQSLIAANANIGVARAAFFPSVNLSSGFSISKSPLGDPATTAMSLAASLAQPIFSGGRLQAGVESANARQAELVENYRKVVLTAFQDVEDALAALKAAQIRNQSLTASAQQAQIAYDIAQKQYDSGLVDFQTFLNAQSTRLNAEDSEAQSRAALLNASVNLYRALGGGWHAGG